MTWQVIDAAPAQAYKRPMQSQPTLAAPTAHQQHQRRQRHIVSAVLVAVAVIHALPVAGVLGARQLVQLYGVPVQDPGLELLLRHRAVLFGLLAALFGWAALQPALHRIALVAGVVSVASFLCLWWSAGATSSALATVAQVDGAALALLVVGAVVHARGQGLAVSG